MLALPPRVASLVRIVGLVLIDWSVISSDHPPGTRGRGLVVSILLGLATVAWLVWGIRAVRELGVALGREPAEGPLFRPELLVMALAGGLLTAGSPDSAASAFVFAAAVAAALRMELSEAAVVILLGAAALAVGTLLYNQSALALLAYTLGFCAAALAGSNSRQAARRAEQAELVLVHTQRSHEEQLRSARLEESTRIARDIHDVLAHTLAGLTIQLEATAALLEGGADREDVLERIRRAHELAREGLKETRRAVGALRSEGPPSIPHALGTLIADYRSATDANASLSIAGDPARLAGRAGEAVVRITQEALTNVKKHAFGAEVTVQLVLDGDGVCLTVEDRALAGAPAGELASAGGGFGLRGMRERAAELGGRLTAGPCECGWRVQLRLPAPVELA
ncbi:MAG TPA: sensor histidine kinase [Solirubrobacteraceae bacterium]|jgi:signal transduction histidine kinase|nr:sensor histidine kinase [Solirubrobacteraceae bacterium]